jgi:hypothetical protein
MNAVSGKNLTDARAVDANDVRTALDAGAGHSAVSPASRRLAG